MHHQPQHHPSIVNPWSCRILGHPGFHQLGFPQLKPVAGSCWLGFFSIFCAILIRDPPMASPVSSGTRPYPPTPFPPPTPKEKWRRSCDLEIQDSVKPRGHPEKRDSAIDYPTRSCRNVWRIPHETGHALPFPPPSTPTPFHQMFRSWRKKKEEGRDGERGGGNPSNTALPGSERIMEQFPVRRIDPGDQDQIREELLISDGGGLTTESSQKDSWQDSWKWSESRGPSHSPRVFLHTNRSRIAFKDLSSPFLLLPAASTQDLASKTTTTTTKLLFLFLIWKGGKQGIVNENPGAHKREKKEKKRRGTVPLSRCRRGGGGGGGGGGFDPINSCCLLFSEMEGACPALASNVVAAWPKTRPDPDPPDPTDPEPGHDGGGGRGGGGGGGGGGSAQEIIPRWLTEIWGPSRFPLFPPTATPAPFADENPTRLDSEKPASVLQLTLMLMLMMMMMMMISRWEEEGGGGDHDPHHEIFTLMKCLARVKSPRVVWRADSGPSGTKSFNFSRHVRSWARLFQHQPRKYNNRMNSLLNHDEIHWIAMMHRRRYR